MASFERLTNEILQKALAKKSNVDVKEVVVHDFKVSAGAKPGDNFACDVKAVEVDATIKGVQQSVNVIAKLLPTDKMRMEMLGNVED